jgi:hypothetical protein
MLAMYVGAVASFNDQAVLTIVPKVAASIAGGAGNHQIGLLPMIHPAFCCRCGK